MSGEITNMYYSKETGFTSEKTADDQVFVYDVDYQSLMQALQNGAYIETNINGYPVAKFNPMYYYKTTGFTQNRVNELQIEITYEYWSSLIVGQATGGKIITENEDGYPVLGDPPLPTHEDQIAEATRKKATLLAQATRAIDPLQDAVDLDDATDEEVALLKKWKQFRVAVNRVDVSLVPDIVWPIPPIPFAEQSKAPAEAPTS